MQNNGSSSTIFTVLNNSVHSIENFCHTTSTWITCARTLYTRKTDTKTSKWKKEEEKSSSNRILQSIARWLRSRKLIQTRELLCEIFKLFGVVNENLCFFSLCVVFGLSQLLHVLCMIYSKHPFLLFWPPKAN